MQDGQQDPTAPQQQQRPAAPPAPVKASSPPPPPSGWYMPPSSQPKSRKILTKVLTVLLILSVVVNMYLLAAVVAQLDREMSQTTITEGQADQTIALYTVSGMINDESAQRFRQFYETIERNSDVRAVVLRVNSPGGSVSPSDQIHEMVAKIRQSGRKVVVSMGGLAASGGYYISAGADSIFAEPTTVTGSIGVMATWPVVKGTLEKLGAEMVVMKSTRASGWKDEGSFLEKPNARHRKHLQYVLDEIQDQFEQVVTEGRDERLAPRQSNYNFQVGTGPKAKTIQISETEPFNGKIYLADEALRLGLVDAIGYRDAAIDAAAKLAGLIDPNVVEYQPRSGLLANLMRTQSASVLSLSSLDELQTPRILLAWKAQ